VKVIVDSGSLKQAAADKSVCVPVDAKTPASKVLEEAKIKTEGSTQYPDAVCRVNGVPAADFDIKHKDGTYREECKAMSAAFAYWSLWVKPASGAWAYAQEGIATLQVSPGESLELLYSVDGEPAAPAA
jgi:translation initiation factor 1 (eIF-1/SUI1)